LRGELLLALAEAGLPVPVGTDAGVQYVLPGFSIHEELERYRAAGLSPRAVLKAATLDGAAALGAENTGRIAPGWRADLLLLAGDPLEDPAMLNHRVGVMAAGRWYSQSALLATLQAPPSR
jgi:imidazolonepropionase-like amidohydrolase